MRLLDERESIRLYLNRWYRENVDPSYDIPVFIKRIQGDVLPVFTLYLGTSDTARVSIGGSLGLRIWMITFRSNPVDDELIGIDILQRLENDLDQNKYIPGVLVDFGYPSPLTRGDSRQGGNVPRGNYQVRLQGVSYRDDDLDENNLQQKITDGDAQLSLTSLLQNAVVDEDNSRLLVEVPIVFDFNYVGVYVNDRLQALPNVRGMTQSSTFIDTIRDDTLEMSHITSIVPSKSRVYVERASVERLQSQYIDGLEVIGSDEAKSEPFQNILMLSTQVNISRITEATEIIRELGVKRAVNGDNLQRISVK